MDSREYIDPVNCCEADKINALGIAELIRFEDHAAKKPRVVYFVRTVKSVG